MQCESRNVFDPAASIPGRRIKVLNDAVLWAVGVNLSEEPSTDLLICSCGAADACSPHRSAPIDYDLDDLGVSWASECGGEQDQKRGARGSRTERWEPQRVFGLPSGHRSRSLRGCMCRSLAANS